MKVENYFEGIQKNNLAVLGKSITLIESSLEKDKKDATQLIEKCIPHTGKSIRIGVSGTPGVGKSTFIDFLGAYLIKKGNRIAVLTIDPSSSISKGSILGDKTRMEKLSKSDLAFIRSSPSLGALGGISNTTRDSILICEAAGFNIIIIETLGVGQSEILVESITDFFIYLTLIENGDGLQFIKKGALELSDIILINKCEKKIKEAEQVKYLMQNNIANSEYNKRNQTVFICSALTGLNIENIWSYITTLYNNQKKSGKIKQKREKQDLFWLKKMLEDELKILLFKKIKSKKIIFNFKNISMKNTRKLTKKIIKENFKVDF